MKFGRLVYKYTGKTIVGNSAIYNIGDNFQSFAISNIYRRMGIKEEDIIDINACEMKNYDGDYVIVLMAGYASHYKRFNQLPASSKIFPLFFSFEMSDVTCDDIVPYLKKYMPIGCRDEATMLLLREKGVDAYITGCLTITLPKRKREPDKKKVFFVDIPTKLKEYIPLELKENCEYIQQEGTIDNIPMTEEDRKKIDDYAKFILQRYESEATLVVTSRLHAAVPCLALGIPVILAIDNVDSRFSWLDKLIPLYDSEHYAEINWNPKAVDIENLKEQIIRSVCKRLNKLKEEKEDIFELSKFWEDREKVKYNHKLFNRLSYLQQRYSVDDSFNYIIWGAGVHGRMAYTMIKEIFPNAKLLAIVDNYMTGKMFDVEIIKPKDAFGFIFDYALITTHPGRFEAVSILSDMNKIQHRDWCYFMSKDIPDENGR